jgi:ATP synthase protein I
MDEEERRRHRMQMMMNYMMLPFVLAIPPIVGWYIGTWLDGHFDISPYGKYVLLALGFISGVREFYRIVTKYKDEDL